MSSPAQVIAVQGSGDGRPRSWVNIQVHTLRDTVQEKREGEGIMSSTSRRP